MSDIKLIACDLDGTLTQHKEPLSPEYHVFIIGSSSFDMAPKSYNKYYALDLYCRECGLTHDQVVFVGDDYEPGGNDASVYDSDFGFIKVADYHTFPDRVAHLLK